MPNLLAMSFEGELAPSFDLKCLAPGKPLPDGWGVGYFPGGEQAASVLKEHAPSPGSIRSELVKAWEHLASSVLVLHIRHATWGTISDANTQPYIRSWGGRDWLFCHSGTLTHRFAQRTGAVFEPVGSTDSELIFCELMDRIAARGCRTLGEVEPEVLHSWFEEFNQFGTLSVVFTDGHDLVVYKDQNLQTGMVYCTLLPPHEQWIFGDNDLEVNLIKRGIKARKGVVFSSAPLFAASSPSMQWKSFTPGQMIVVRQGALFHEVFSRTVATPISSTLVDSVRPVEVQTQQRLEVQHRTTYRYARPVERSQHLLRLVPMHDRCQNLLECNIRVSVDGRQREYEDVFGNRIRDIQLDSPYTELVIHAQSRVQILQPDAVDNRALREQSTFPLVWMPWQRHMLQPYLLPPEIPDSQLEELSEYAMSFVERNDHHLLETLVDINRTIFREYAYQQGTTTLVTTPFDVYASRRGVCQDFANLFICMARLLSIPARYMCGYIYTGPNYENRVQSEASHAWVEVYLPHVGWKGFDPTNGILTATDHIRVAVGRNYVDATPTSGTIFVGGGYETLEVLVQVQPQL